MRSVLTRLLLACGLLAVAAVSVPPAAGAAAPHGSLTTAEYDLLLASYQRSEALEDDRKPTIDELGTACEALAPRPTALVSAAFALCRGGLRVASVGISQATGKPCSDEDTRCAARELLRMETATRAVVRLTRAQRRAVAARGLTGQCARAIGGPPEALRFMEAFSNALRDLRRALLADDREALDRAATRFERATNLAAAVQDEDSVALLTTCPRV